MATPLYYTEAEGGPWKEWTFGNVDGRSLMKRDKDAVSINHITVHSLQFGPYDEWDCVNGKRVFNAEMAAERAPEPTAPPTEPTAVVPKPDAQGYAMRVWNGQSVSLGIGERKARVRAALEGQGLSMDGVVLPGVS